MAAISSANHFKDIATKLQACDEEQGSEVKGTSSLKRPLAMDKKLRRVRGRGLTAQDLALESMPSSGDDVSDSRADYNVGMRSCKDCGHELHVRRIRCTDCDSVQVSKHAIAIAKAEADGVTAAAFDIDRCHREAEAAASQLTSMNASVVSRADLDDHGAKVASQGAAVTLPAVASFVPVAYNAHSGNAAALACDAWPVSWVGVPATGTKAKAHAITLAAVALAKLSPEKLIKFHRMRKLRALLSKVPANIDDIAMKQLTKVRTYANGIALEHHIEHRHTRKLHALLSQVPNDAISMLASVACSSSS